MHQITNETDELLASAFGNEIGHGARMCQGRPQRRLIGGAAEQSPSFAVTSFTVCLFLSVGSATLVCSFNSKGI